MMLSLHIQEGMKILQPGFLHWLIWSYSRFMSYLEVPKSVF